MPSVDAFARLSFRASPCNARHGTNACTCQGDINLCPPVLPVTPLALAPSYCTPLGAQRGGTRRCSGPRARDLVTLPGYFVFVVFPSFVLGCPLLPVAAALITAEQLRLIHNNPATAEAKSGGAENSSSHERQENLPQPRVTHQTSWPCCGPSAYRQLRARGRGRRRPLRDRDACAQGRTHDALY